MDIILSTSKLQFAFAYLGDVVTFSRPVEEHLNLLQTVLGLLSSAGISLTLKKCFFFEDYTNYLGHLIQPCRPGISRRETYSICGFQPPANVIELKSILSLCNVFLRFLSNFTSLVTPLNRKLEKDQPFNFARPTKTEIERLEMLQHQLLSPSIL